MKVIIFIQTAKSGTSREAIRASEELNMYTILLTNNKKQLKQREEYTDVHDMIYIEELNYKNICRYLDTEMNDCFKIGTILSFIDGYSTLASRLRDKYTKNPSKSNAIGVMEDKLLTRIKLRNYPFTPYFKEITLKDDNVHVLKFPLIIKKRISTASRDVKLINSIEDISTKFYKSHDVFIEDYIDKDQYLIEVFVRNSKPISIIKIKQDVLLTKNNTFIVVGYTLDKNTIISESELSMIQIIIDELNFKNGDFHIEVREDEESCKLIEINPRAAGGSISHIIKYATDTNYIEQVVKFYLGMDFTVPIVKKDIFNKYLTSNISGVLEKVTGKNSALNSEGVLKVYVKPRKGNHVVEPYHMGDRIGYVMATGKDNIEAKDNSLNAVDEINFQLKEDS
ncbi:ATP-grasp domain-containing protein [Mycoplasmatota bacterium WC44]